MCLLRDPAPGVWLQQPRGDAEAEPTARGLQRRTTDLEGDPGFTRSCLPLHPWDFSWECSFNRVPFSSWSLHLGTCNRGHLSGEHCKQLVKVSQSCPTLCDPMHCRPPGSSVHGILQAKILEWVAISSSRESSWPRDQTQVSCFAGRFFTIWATREAPWTIRNFHFKGFVFWIVNFNHFTFCLRPLWSTAEWLKEVDTNTDMTCHYCSSVWFYWTLVDLQCCV